MDDPGLGPAEHAAALRGLRRINAVSGVVGTLWRELRVRAERKRAAGNGSVSASGLRVVDVACGGGDVAAGLNARARRAGEEAAVLVDGCDVSERALGVARENWSLKRPVREERGVGVGEPSFFVWDALSGEALVDPKGNRYDVSICTLFLHHLETEQAAAVLRAMDAGCEGGGVVLDLRSGRWAWLVTWVGVRLLSRSRVVHYDGPASVRAGWTRAELEGAARSAGLADFRVSRSFPLRWKLVWGAAA